MTNPGGEQVATIRVRACEAVRGREAGRLHASGRGRSLGQSVDASCFHRGSLRHLGRPPVLSARESGRRDDHYCRCWVAWRAWDAAGVVVGVVGTFAIGRFRRREAGGLVAASSVPRGRGDAAIGAGEHALMVSGVCRVGDRRTLACERSRQAVVVAAVAGLGHGRRALRIQHGAGALRLDPGRRSDARTMTTRQEAEGDAWRMRTSAGVARCLVHGLFAHRGEPWPRAGVVLRGDRCGWPGGCGTGLA